MKLAPFVLAAALVTFSFAQAQISFAQVPETPETLETHELDSSLSSSSPSDAELTIDITDLRNDSGRLYISVYKDADAFPDNGSKAVLSKVTGVLKGAVRVKMGKLKPGIYAISFMHDENGNGKMDTNFLGIPKEGFGFSNDPTITFGPPSFDKAKVEIKAPAALVRIKTKYF